MKKNILIFSLNNKWSPHFETELEIILDQQAAGHTVFVLACGKKLATCSSNNSHVAVECIKCVSKFHAGLAKIQFPLRNVFYLQHPPTYPWLPKTFSSFEELLTFSVDGINFGRWVASSLISNTRTTTPNLIQHAAWITKALKSSFMIYSSMLRVTKMLLIDEVYLFNGRFADAAPARLACEVSGIPFYSHERGGVLDRYLLIPNGIPHTLYNSNTAIPQHWNSAPINIREAIGSQWFVDRRKGIEQNWFSFGKDQIVGQLPASFDKNKKNIAIFNSSIDEFFVFEEWQNPLYPDETDALEDIIMRFTNNNENVHFYLRIHPYLKGIENAQMKKLHKLAAQSFAHLTIIWPEQNIDSYALLENCDKAIVFGSTIGAEACFWGKPAILVGRSYYDKLDCTYQPKDREELMRLIIADLKQKPALEAIKYGFWETTKGIPFKHYRPTGLFSGAFQGNQLNPQFSLLDRTKLKFYYKAAALKKRVAWFSSRRAQP